MLKIQSFMICRGNAMKRMHELVERGKTDTEEFANLNLQVIQLQRMLNYVIRGNWCGAKTQEVFVFWMKSNYNVELTSQKYRIPVSVVEQLVKEADRVLARKIEKPLQMICANKLYEGAIAFNMAISKSPKKVTKRK